MRAEDHHPRKTDGNQHNCEHAARSRSVKPCERPLRSACGPELDVIQAGWLLTVASNVSGEIFRGWCLTVFPSLHVRRDTTEADTHRRFLRGCIFGPGCKSRRLQPSLT